MKKQVILGMTGLLSLSLGLAGANLLHKTNGYVLADEEQSTCMKSEDFEASLVDSSQEVEESSEETATSSSSSSKEETTDTTSSAASSSENTTNSTTSSGNSGTSVSESSTNKTTSSSTTTSSSKSASYAPTKKEAEELKKDDVGQVDEDEVTENYEFSVVKNTTTQEFIDQIGEDAQSVAWENDLYASVMIAQAILETGSGNSTLSRAPNYNLFGIKGSYKGSSVTFNTQEDDGSGSLYTISSAFRKYPGFKESLEDYAVLLKGGISGNSSFYSKTWKSNTNTYKDATAFLTGRYATDTQYNTKLNALIAAYDLTQYDGEPGKKAASKTEETSESTTKTSSTTSSDTDENRSPSSEDRVRAGGMAALAESTATNEEAASGDIMTMDPKDISMGTSIH